MKSSDALWLSAGVALSRFVFRSHYLYDVDSVNFALALEAFDPETHQPHPPGYFLYVCAGRLAYRLLGDANSALVALSIVASCAAVVLIYTLAQAWFGRRAAVAAGLIFLFSPLAWFHGTVALTYIIEASFSALVGYLCWQSYSGRTSFLPLGAAVLGIAAGFRPSALLMLGPLWLLSMRPAGRQQRLVALAVLGLCVGAWFVPMILASGGPARYLASLGGLWSLVPGRQNAVTSAVLMSVARFWTVLGILGLCFGAASVLAFAAGGRTDPARRMFCWVWVGPALAFFTLVFLKFVNSGYLLVVTPPMFAWLGQRAAAWCTTPRRMGAAGLLAAVNAGLYLWSPWYCSHRAVIQFEQELAGVTSSLPSVAGPQEALLVGFDSHFLGYRHAAYYLPEYLTLQFPAVRSAGGSRIFAARGRRTMLLSRAPVEAFARFVLLPLPPGQRYQEYVEGVRSRLPEGTLHRERGFLVGSSAALVSLFGRIRPVTEAPPLYTGVNSSQERRGPTR